MRLAPPTALAVALLLVYACGQPKPGPEDAGADASVEPVDSGVPDAGHKDAGVKDAGIPDAGFGPFGVEQWCDLQALAKCRRAQRCLSLAVEQWDTCITREKSTCDQAALQAGVDQGRLQYLPQEAANCVNAYEQATCLETPTACEPVFQGLVAADGGCLLGQECQSGNYCLTYASTCPYTCFAYQPVGAPCNYWERQCDPTVGSCQNVDGGLTCVPLKGVGDSCVYWSDCRSDLACINNVCLDREADLGQPCREAQGYPYCTGDSYCRQPYAPDGTELDAGVCVRKAGLGGVCSGYGSCITGLRCSSNYATGTCIPLGAVGDTCTNYNDCQQELFCQPSTSRCQELPGDGGDCSYLNSSYRCRPGYYCDYQSTLCTALKPQGEPCNYDGVCASGSCEWGALPDGGNGLRCVDTCLTRLDGGF